MIDVHHQSKDAAFLSFLADQPDGTSFELGAIVRQKDGVTLGSRQGDFAEWHQRKAGERPFVEGDVVGFGRRGEISRQTTGAYMLGVISRQAVVEGSRPASHESRGQFDTVGSSFGSRFALCCHPAVTVVAPWCRDAIPVPLQHITFLQAY